MTDDTGEFFTPAQVEWAMRRALKKGKRLGRLEVLNLLRRTREDTPDDDFQADDLDPFDDLDGLAFDDPDDDDED